MMNRRHLKTYACVLLIFLTGACNKDKAGAKGGKEPSKGAAGAGSRGGGRGGGGPVAVRVQTAAVKTLPSNLSLITQLTGRKQADVYAKVLGRLSSIGKREGEAVKAGEVLFKVDRSDPGESFLSTPVVSPLTGWVGHWYVTSLGEQVTTQSPVVTIVDDEALRATVELPTREWLLVNKDTPVTVTVANDERPGKVLTIARSGDAASGRGSVTIEIANANRAWRSGMVARIRLGLDPKERIVIPATALIITDNGAFVYVVDGEAVRRAKVAFVLIDADQVEITEGLKNQEQVVVQGTNMLSDKAAIKIAPSDEQTDQASPRTSTPTEPASTKG